jgi:hypothetical protein
MSRKKAPLPVGIDSEEMLHEVDDDDSDNCCEHGAGFDESCEWCGYDDEELACTHCGGEREEQNDDPLWYGFDIAYIPCRSCSGTGLRKHQTIF